MTEDEAKTKWCPMAREWGDENSYNRVLGKADEHTKCIASDCMMWIATDNEVGAMSGGTRPIRSQPAGYCGLANERR